MPDFILIVLGAVLGWFGQWLLYRYQRRDEQRQGPNVVGSKVRIGTHTLVNLHNIGHDTLNDMDVEIGWLQDDQRQKRYLRRFVHEHDDPSLARPFETEVLNHGDTLRVIDVPSWSGDGLIDVQVSGLGVNSQRLYSAVSQIAVGLPRHT